MKGLVVVLFAVVAVLGYFAYTFDKRMDAVETVQATIEGGKVAKKQLTRSAVRAEAKGVVQAVFGDEFVAAAPTWANPVEPECSWGQPPTMGDCLAQRNEVCALRCCGDWALATGNLGASCRIQVRQVLGPPGPYPPPIASGPSQ